MNDGVGYLRVRVRYSVRGKVRFLSHRDVARVTERAIRRAGVPVAYTQGYSPRPKVQYGLALSTGYESTGEYMDIYLDTDREGSVEPAEIAVALDASMPRGLDVCATALVDPGEGSLQDSVEATSWEIEIAPESPVVGELPRLIDDLMSAESREIEIVRKGKPVREDLRPAVHELSSRTGGAPPTPSGPATSDENDRRCVVVSVELGTKPRSIRPAELLGALGITEIDRVCRTHQWTNRNGERSEPLGLDVSSLRTELCAT